MRPRRFGAFLLAIVLLTTACGGGGGATTTTPGAETSPGATPGGDGTETGTASSPSNAGLPPSVPDDFPIAIAPGWEVDLNGEIGLTVNSPRLLYPVDAYDDLVAFYDAWAADQSFECTRGDTADSVTFSCFDDSPYQVTILSGHEERDDTWTLLSASGSAGG